jgi:HEAT repeat protein
MSGPREQTREKIGRQEAKMIAREREDTPPGGEAVPRLVLMLLKAEGPERSRIREKISRVGEAAIPTLSHLLEDGRWRIRREAVKALEAIGSAAAAEALTRALSDESSSVRWVAAEALSALGPCALEGLLRGVIDHGSSPRFRTAAHHALLGQREGPAGDLLDPVIRALERSGETCGRILAAHTVLDRLHAWCEAERPTRV